MKKRTYGSGSVTEKNNRWYLRIRQDGSHKSIPLIDPDTKEPCKTKAHAERVSLRILGLGHHGISKKPLIDLSNDFLKSNQQGYSEGTLYNHIKWFERFDRVFPTIDTITPETLGIYARERSENGIQASTINRELSALRRVLNWAVETDRIKKNPMKGYKFLPEPHYRERVLSRDEISRLMLSLEKPRFAGIRLIVLIALYCGLRRGEILSLKWDHLGDKEFYLLKTKTGRKRRVPVPPGLWDDIQALPRVSAYLFPSKDVAKPLVDPKKLIMSLWKDAEIEGFTFHDLRHTAATWMLRNGVDLNVVRDILGHASIQTTQRYLNAMESDKRKAVDWHSKG